MSLLIQKSNYSFLFTLPIILFFGYVFCDCIVNKNYWAFWIQSINIAIHEWWHVFFGFFWNQFLYVAWWTIMQLLVPIFIMIWFIKQKDFFWVSTIFPILWINFFHISLYAWDATKWNLPMLKFFWDWYEYIHDWNYMLNETWLIHYTDTISFWIWLLAILCFLIFFVYSILLIINRFRD